MKNLFFRTGLLLIFTSFTNFLFSQDDFIKWNSPILLTLDETSGKIGLDSLVSFKGSFGVVITDNHEKAQAVVRDGMRSLYKFSRLFKKDLPQIVLSTTKLNDSEILKLKKMGFKWWFTLEPYDSIIDTNCEDSNENLKITQLIVDWNDGELSENPTFMEVTSNKEKQLGYVSFGKEVESLGMWPTVYRHELGHLMTNLFLLTLDGLENHTAGGYDNKTADYLDEMVATLMEGGTGKDYWQGSYNWFRDDKLLLPSELEKMFHSFNEKSKQFSAAKKSIDAGRGDEETGKIVKIDSSNNNGAIIQNHSYLFANFLLSTSGTNDVLISLYETLAEKEDLNLSNWLSTEGRRFSLPDNIEDLDKKWIDWINSRMRNYTDKQSY